MKHIITISRQFGSGGREIGRRLAQALGYAYYDRQLVVELAERTDLAEDYLQRIDQMDPVPIMPMTFASTFTQSFDPVADMSQEIYHKQSELIRDLAERSDCVIVGRAADYILKDKHPLRLFIVADDDFRMDRCRLKGQVPDDMTDKRLCKEIRAIDKRRGRYYEFYTGQTWGEATNYDVVINTSQIGVDRTIEMIKHLVLHWNGEYEGSR